MNFWSSRRRRRRCTIALPTFCCGRVRWSKSVNITCRNRDSSPFKPGLGGGREAQTRWRRRALVTAVAKRATSAAANVIREHGDGLAGDHRQQHEESQFGDMHRIGDIKAELRRKENVGGGKTADES